MLRSFPEFFQREQIPSYSQGHTYAFHIVAVSYPLWSASFFQLICRAFGRDNLLRAL
jgi:hypothetical protein